MGAAGRACPADQCNQSSGQELLPGGEREHAVQVRASTGRKLGARSKFDIPTPMKVGIPSKAVVDPRWVFTWKMVESKRNVNPRSAAKGCHCPDLGEGLVETPGFVSLRPSRPQAVVSLGLSLIGCVSRLAACSQEMEAVKVGRSERPFAGW